MASLLSYNSTVYPCSVDIDCPGTSVCYFINKDNPKQGFCSCNVEQGSKGLLCEEISASGYARIVGLSLDISFTIILFIAIMYEILIVLRIKKVNIFDARFTSLLMYTVGLISFIIYIGVPLYWTLNPGLPFVADPLTGKKRRPLSELRSAALCINSFFYLSGSLNISILWLEVAIASKRFLTLSGPQLSRNYRYAVMMVDIIFALVLGFTSWYAPNMTSLAGAVIFIIIFGLYIYSAYEITVMVNKSFLKSQLVPESEHSKMNGMRDSLILIKKFVIQFVTLNLLWMIFHLSGSIMYQRLYKRAWDENEIVSFMLLFDIGFLFSIGASLSLVKYVHDVSTKSKLESSSSISRINTRIVSNTGTSSVVIVPAKKNGDGN